jgi:hypothetical protein
MYVYFYSSSLGRREKEKEKDNMSTPVSISPYSIRSSTIDMMLSIDYYGVLSRVDS